jgi:hypothetical protein
MPQIKNMSKSDVHHKKKEYNSTSIPKMTKKAFTFFCSLEKVVFTDENSLPWFISSEIRLKYLVQLNEAQLIKVYRFQSHANLTNIHRLAVNC